MQSLKSMRILSILILTTSLVFAQRGETGDKTFSHRFPADITNEVSGSSLEILNTVEQDIIIVIRDQYKKYLRHVYVRTNESYTFINLPITRIYVQFKSLEFYFEDRQVQVINFGEKHKFMFFYDASQEGNYFEITEEEFFKS